MSIIYDVLFYDVIFIPQEDKMSMINQHIWEENDLTEQEKNCLSNNAIEQKDTIKSIKNDLTERVCEDTGKISGIYKIVNKTNGKYYVGSSTDIRGKRGRWYKHKRMLKEQCHPNSHLQNSWNKYGENNFDWVITEECLPNDLLVREQYYLNISKSEKNKVYNSSFLAGRVEMTEDVCRKISEANRNRVWSEKTRKLISFNNTKEKHPLWGKRFSKKKCNIRSDNPMFDKTIYEFTNDIENFKGYRSDFIKLFDNKKSAEAAVSAIIKGKKKSHLKWRLRIHPSV